MIIVNLKGGTGNQMFQYALGRKLAVKNSDVLMFDTEDLTKANELGNIFRELQINKFNVVSEEINLADVKRAKYPHGYISKLSRIFKSKILRQHNVLFNAKVLNLTGDIYLDGYWQSPMYFADIRETLLKDFTLKSPLSETANSYKDAIFSCESVSVHIRRGDYVNNPRVTKENGVCTIRYYENAITEMNKKAPNAHYFIFSDDITWVKENLPIPSKTTFILNSGMTDVEELYLMSLCNNNIIANSSFSWWAAWLNQNESKIVICPTPWFDTLPYDKDLIPKTWIQLQKN